MAKRWISVMLNSRKMGVIQKIKLEVSNNYSLLSEAELGYKVIKTRHTSFLVL